MVEIRGDPTRQAISSLSGYVYQIYASSLSWVSLSDNECLFLEVAEDYTVATQAALKGIQVKNTNASLTVNSPDVLASINSFFDLKVRNPDKVITFKHLTTSNIGKEKKKADQILGQATLLYWENAAKSEKVSPLRKQLLKLELSPPAQEFIGNSSDQEFRNHFLKRFDWITGAEDIESLRKQLADRLVIIGERKGIPSSVCDKLVDLLISRVFTEIVSSQSRKLSKSDFLRFFDDNTHVNVPHDLLGKLIRSNLSSEKSENSVTLFRSNDVLNKFSRDSNSGFLTRTELQSLVANSISKVSVAWIYGGAGYGKTSLAEDYARQDSGVWKALLLRGLSSDQTAKMIHNASAQLAIDRPDGLLMDDLEHHSTGIVKNAISQLFGIAFKFGTKILITSSNAISLTVVNSLHLTGLTPIHASDFSEREVGELVEKLGGPQKYWKKYVYVVASAGHPQLVHAMCLWLSDKDWPNSELHSLDALLGKNDAIEQTRHEIRLRIVEELPKDRRRLLLRLSLIIGQYSRNLAISLGEISPVLDEAGIELDKLIGAWIEVVSDKNLRTSSLVANAGSKTLLKDEQRAIHYKIASEYINPGTIDANKIDQILTHALLGENSIALTACAIATIAYPAEDLSELAKISLIATNFSTKKPIYPADSEVSRILRIQQILLTAALLNKAKFESAFSAYNAEIMEVDDQVPDYSAKAIIQIKLLMQDGLINVVENLPVFVIETKELSDGLELEIPKMNLQSLGEISKLDEYLQFVFAFQITKINDFSVLRKILEQLHTLTSEQIEFLKYGFNNGTFEELIIIKSPWLHAIQNNENINEHFAQNYTDLARDLVKWGDEKFAISSFETASIIWDEDLNNSDRALEVLSEALQIFGPHCSLIRAKSRVLFHQKHYVDQIKLASTIFDNFSGGDIEEAYFCREIAIAYSHLNQHLESVKFYARGRECASKIDNQDMRIMAIGFMADEAVEHHYDGANHKAVKLLAETLSLVEGIVPTSSLRAAAIHRLLPHTVMWLLTRISNRMRDLDMSLHQMVSGANSNPTPHKDFEKDQPRPLEYAWYILADIESELDINMGVKGFLFSEKANYLSVLTSELISLPTAMRSAFRLCDSSNYQKLLARTLDACVYAEEHGSEIEKSDIFKPNRCRLPALSTSEFLQHRGRLTRNILAFILHICFRKNADQAFLFLQNIKNDDSPILSDKLQQAVSEAIISSNASDIAFCGIVGCILENTKSGEQMAASDMLIVSLRLLEIIEHDSLHLVIAPLALKWLKNQWSLILDEQSFNIRNPTIAKQLFDELLDRDLQGCRGIADMVLYLETTVKTTLGEKYRNQLEAKKESG